MPIEKEGRVIQLKAHSATDRQIWLDDISKYVPHVALRVVMTHAVTKSTSLLGVCRVSCGVCGDACVVCRHIQHALQRVLGSAPTPPANRKGS